jgi:integrase/recombinase XerD
MKAKNYSINTHWDKRYPKAGTDLCPVQLAVNLSGLQFKVSLKLYANKADYDKALNSKGGSEEVKELRKQITDYTTKAELILERLPNPTREVFQRLFKSETDLFASQKTDITFLYEEYINHAKDEGRIKTAQNLEWSLKSFKRYKTKIYFEDINEQWLKGYKTYMAKEGNSATTAQMYLRNLRTIFNIAIKQGYISEKHYPFRLFTIGTSAKSKSVLYEEDLKKLWNYQGNTLRERRSLDYFWMCYLSNGFNFKDCCYLKFKNIKGDTLSFVREKTKNTNTVADKQISVYINDKMRSIIDTWGNKPGNSEDYIFPILNDRTTAEDKEERRHKIQKQINANLKIIGKKLGIEEKVILNVARHSFATTLKVNGTPTSFIGDAMGHSNSKTTEHYLKSIPTEKAREMSDSLLSFNDPKV